MKLGTIPYPCVGYCIIDARGYCVACGRPPTLGAPDTCATAKTAASPADAATAAAADADADTSDR